MDKGTKAEKAYGGLENIFGFLVMAGHYGTYMQFNLYSTYVYKYLYYY